MDMRASTTCLLGTGRNPCAGKNEERKIHDRGNKIIYFEGDSFGSTGFFGGDTSQV